MTTAEANLSAEMGQTAKEGTSEVLQLQHQTHTVRTDAVSPWEMSSVQYGTDHGIFSSNHSVTITELPALCKVVGFTPNLLHEEILWHAIGVSWCNLTSRNQHNAAGHAEIQNSSHGMLQERWLLKTILTKWYSWRNIKPIRLSLTLISSLLCASLEAYKTLQCK